MVFTTIDDTKTKPVCYIQLGDGDIGVCPFLGKIGEADCVGISFTNVEKRQQGEVFPNNGISDDFDAMMSFSKLVSIDALIRNLNLLKEKYEHLLR